MAKPFTKTAAASIAVILALGWPAISWAQEGAEAEAEDPNRGALSGDLSRLDDAELEARIAFIEERMDEGRTHAQVWQYGFTGGYGAGVAIGVIGATTTNDSDNRVNHIVTGIKGAFGVTRMLWAPHPGRHGADPIRDVQGDTRDDKIRRLAVAEDLLEENAERSESRWAWERHVMNAGVNAAGGIAVGLLGETEDAIVSSVIGFAVGTAHAFLMPWRYTGDRDDYLARFEGAETSRIEWDISPMVTADGTAGLQLGLQF